VIRSCAFCRWVKVGVWASIFPTAVMLLGSAGLVGLLPSSHRDWWCSFLHFARCTLPYFLQEELWPRFRQRSRVSTSLACLFSLVYIPPFCSPFSNGHETHRTHKRAPAPWRLSGLDL
jgi:hypothetical protein